MKMENQTVTPWRRGAESLVDSVDRWRSTKSAWLAIFWSPTTYSYSATPPMTSDFIKDFGLHHSPPLEKDSTLNICSLVMERLGNLLFSFLLERNKIGTISNPPNLFLWTPISTTLPLSSLSPSLYNNPPYSGCLV